MTPTQKLDWWVFRIGGILLAIIIASSPLLFVH
jgi:hypothetical protein